MPRWIRPSKINLFRLQIYFDDYFLQCLYIYMQSSAILTVRTFHIIMRQMYFNNEHYIYIIYINTYRSYYSYFDVCNNFSICTIPLIIM